VVRGIRKIAERGGPKNADHILNNVATFINWRRKPAAAAEKIDTMFFFQ